MFRPTSNLTETGGQVVVVVPSPRRQTIDAAFTLIILLLYLQLKYIIIFSTQYKRKFLIEHLLFLKGCEMSFCLVKGY